MSIQIKKASRELVFSKIALMGASGSGKTYSALRLAKGMSESLQKVLGKSDIKTLMLNTETSRGLYYANEFDYDIANIDPPHTPEKYVEAIYDAVKLGYDILILDSSSHEWEGSGGCLAIQQLLGGKYQDWAKVTPRHNAFIEAIAESPIHIIATMRGKDQYEMEKTDGNKATVRKLGIGAKQREGFEYEFSLTLLLDQQDNFAQTQKDNTHLFETRGRFLITEKDGVDIVAWANSGSGYTPSVRNKPGIEPIAALKAEIIQICKDLGGKKNSDVMKVLMEYVPDGNPNSISDPAKLAELKSKLNMVQPVQEETN
jgi:hypothetical protein